MNNLKNFIENKESFLRKDFFKELIGEELLEEYNEVFLTTKKKMKVDNGDEILDYYCLREQRRGYSSNSKIIYEASRLFIVNNTTKEIIFFCLKEVENLKLEGYKLYDFKEIKRDLEVLLEKVLIEIIQKNKIKNFLSSIINIYDDKTIENYIFLDGLKNTIDQSKVSSNLKRDIEDLNYVRNIDFLKKSVDFSVCFYYLSIKNLSEEEQIKHLLEFKNPILDIYKKWEFNTNLKNYINKFLFDEKKQHIGDFHLNERFLKYKEIFEALNKAGVTAIINGRKKDCLISYYSEIRVDDINIDNIQEIKFRKKIIYKKD